MFIHLLYIMIFRPAFSADVQIHKIGGFRVLWMDVLVSFQRLL